jgi:hypothetical protein
MNDVEMRSRTDNLMPDVFEMTRSRVDNMT